MATSLRDNLTSSYFNAAHKLYSKKARRRIIAYVESYDDVAFWRTLLEEFEDDEHYFQVMLPSATSLAKGKKMVLMNTLNTAELGRSLIACVDSDYDFLLQGSHEHFPKDQPEQVHIPNLHIRHRKLSLLCRKSSRSMCAGHIERPFYTGFQRLSETVFGNRIYPLFLWNVGFIVNGIRILSRCTTSILILP